MWGISADYSFMNCRRVLLRWQFFSKLNTLYDRIWHNKSHFFPSLKDKFWPGIDKKFWKYHLKAPFKCFQKILPILLSVTGCPNGEPWLWPRLSKIFPKFKKFIAFSVKVNLWQNWVNLAIKDSQNFAKHFNIRKT